MATLAGSDNVSFSLIKLQRLRGILADLDTCDDDLAATRAARLARSVGGSAVRLLCDELAGTSERRSDLAASLLRLLAADDTATRARVDTALRALLREPRAEGRSLRILALLAECGGDLPETAIVDKSSRLRSLRELAAGLDQPGDVAQIVDALATQLSADEFVEFFAEMIECRPLAAVRIADEFLVRDDIDDGARFSVREMRAEAMLLCAKPKRLPRRAARNRRRGRHADGRQLFIAWSTTATGSRVIAIEIDRSGAMLQAIYSDCLQPSEIDEQIVAPTQEHGFELEPVNAAPARAAISSSAKVARRLGAKLPHAFYLGRDLFGLYDEHLEPAHRRTLSHSGSSLSRALVLLAKGDHDEALPIIEDYVARKPSDPEGHINLGLCMLAKGELSAARVHIGKAVELDDKCAMHLWNLAAVCHKAGDRPACAAALRRYLLLSDRDPGAIDRVARAAAFVGECDRFDRMADASVR